MIDLSHGAFQESKTYNAYKSENIFKCNSTDILNILSQIKKSNITEKVLIEIPNTIGLSKEIINEISDNVDIRIIGGHTDEYAKSHKSADMDHFREKATYSKDELMAIMTKISSIEEGINPEWNKYEVALYLYEYIKDDIVYRTPNSKINENSNESLDRKGNANRTRTWDTLTGMINQVSTCSGFSFIYQELCTRQGIKCNQVGGKYLENGEGDHAWNLVTIDGNTFIVDAIWDAMDFEKGIDHITTFGTCDSSKYMPKCYIEEHKKLKSIDKKWVNDAHSKVSSNIPKQLMVKEKIDRFLQLREVDRQRMMQLRNQQLSVIMNNENELINNVGGISR